MTLLISVVTISKIKCDNTLGFHKLFLHHDMDSEPFLFSNFAIHESLIIIIIYYYNIKPRQPVSRFSIDVATRSRLPNLQNT